LYAGDVYGYLPNLCFNNKLKSSKRGLDAILYVVLLDLGLLVSFNPFALPHPVENAGGGDAHGYEEAAHGGVGHLHEAALE
jgi:hypothetical protein